MIDASTKPDQILIVNGDSKGRANLARDIARLGYKVRSTGELSTLRKMIQKEQFSLVVLDVDLFDAHGNGFDALQEIHRTRPACQVITLGQEQTVLSSLLSARFGAVDFFAKPFSFSALAGAVSTAMREKGTRIQPTRTAPMPLVANSIPMQTVLRLVGQATKSDHPVLLSGKTGTGKAHIARIIHQYSNQKTDAFLVVPPTGVRQQIPPLMHSDGEPLEGSVFLTRIDRLSSRDQSLVCDWIDYIDATGTKVRFLASFDPTKKSSLGPELLSRLNVLLIQIPELRQRREDILELAKEFLDQQEGSTTTITSDALSELRLYSWPSNVRELKNLMTRLALQVTGQQIEGDDIRSLFADQTGNSIDVDTLEDVITKLVRQLEKDDVGDKQNTGLFSSILENFEKPLLKLVLESVNGNQVKAAQKLGIHRNTLRSKIEKYQLNRKKW
jgi:two-component system nitrogen regulation response regulator GlnG